jgi:hypothetical protein
VAEQFHETVTADAVRLIVWREQRREVDTAAKQVRRDHPHELHAAIKVLAAEGLTAPEMPARLEAFREGLSAYHPAHIRELARRYGAPKGNRYRSRAKRNDGRALRSGM